MDSSLAAVRHVLPFEYTEFHCQFPSAAIHATQSDSTAISTKQFGDRLRFGLTASLVLHRAQNFSGQAFHLFSLVEEQVELDQFGSRLRDLAQPCDAGF